MRKGGRVPKSRIKGYIDKSLAVFTNWLGDSVDQHPYWSVLVSVSLLMGTMAGLSANRPVAFILAILTFIPALPIVIAAAWLEKSFVVKKLWSKWWVKALLGIVFAIDVVQANSWAQGVIVDTFGVPPSALPLTQTLMTWAYVPAVVLQPIFENGLIPAVMVVMASVLYQLIFKEHFWDGMIKSMWILATVAVLSFYSEAINRFADDPDSIAHGLGLYLDFHTENPCENFNVSPEGRVLLIDAERALVYFPPSTLPYHESSIEIRKCELTGPGPDTG